MKQGEMNLPDFIYSNGDYDMRIEEMRKKVYLDCCCYNRPYDNQTQMRISL